MQGDASFQGDFALIGKAVEFCDIVSLAVSACNRQCYTCGGFSLGVGSSDNPRDSPGPIRRSAGSDPAINTGEFGVRSRLAALAAFAVSLISGTAFAAGPRNWQLGLPEPASPTAGFIYVFHDWLVVMCTVISVFVLALLLWVAFRFNEKRNPTPSTRTHNSLLEVVWTVVPILILLLIAIPSFRLLYFADRTPDPDMTLKIIGNQWYWSYEYPDHGNFTFDANLVAEADLKPGQKRLMDTDNPVVLPAGKKVRLLMTATDVLHAWAITALGVRLDTVPGQTNETWVQIDKPGVYYGFCSELCGAGHAYMPIMVKAVTPAEFDAWVAQAKTKFARIDEPTPQAISPPSAVKVATGKTAN